jgi:hypothetical protein
MSSAAYEPPAVRRTIQTVKIAFLNFMPSKNVVGYLLPAIDVPIPKGYLFINHAILNGLTELSVFLT